MEHNRAIGPVLCSDFKRFKILAKIDDRDIGILVGGRHVAVRRASPGRHDPEGRRGGPGGGRLLQQLVEARLLNLQERAVLPLAHRAQNFCEGSVVKPRLDESVKVFEAATILIPYHHVRDGLSERRFAASTHSDEEKNSTGHLFRGRGGKEE